MSSSADLARLSELTLRLSQSGGYADEALPVAEELVRACKAQLGSKGEGDYAPYAGRLLDVEAMLAAPDEPLEWRCQEIAADGYLTVLAGRGGEGKSWLALALACGVARGQAVAGIDCAAGRALIFDAENGAKLIARRFRAGGVTPDLSVQPVDAGGLRLRRDLEWFQAVIEAERADLVVFDSLRVLSSGVKESDSDEMEPLVTALKEVARETGAAVVLIHHRGKSELSEFRGSSVILDQADLLFTLGRVSGDPEGRHRRRITAIKCRIEEEPAPRWVTIAPDRSRGLVTIDEADAYDSEGADRPRDALRDDVLGVLASEPKPGARIATLLGRSKTDGTIRRVLSDLQADGLAEKRADGWSLPVRAPLGSGVAGNPSENGSGTAETPLPPASGDGNL
ncbi:AAA family ATPase [Thermoleophilia bacterium SCSIO 60948]|nr:AAA family ATPase [Thermoleophilia bacterium SCSIO 60948]